MLFCSKCPSVLVKSSSGNGFSKKPKKYINHFEKIIHKMINWTFFLTLVIISFRYSGSSVTKNNKRPWKVFFAATARSMIPANQKKAKVLIRQMLKFPFLRNYVIQFFHQGLSRQSLAWGGHTRLNFVDFSRPYPDRPNVPKMLLMSTVLGFQTHKYQSHKLDYFASNIRSILFLSLESWQCRKCG